MQKWCLKQHYSIPFWGLDNIYKILITPNGFKFTICQVISSIKLVVDYIAPLFIVINVSPKCEVVIIYDISMKAEAKGLPSHLGIYVALIFGSVVFLDKFTVSYKASIEP